MAVMGKLENEQQQEKERESGRAGKLSTEGLEMDEKFSWAWVICIGEKLMRPGGGRRGGDE